MENLKVEKSSLFLISLLNFKYKILFLIADIRESVMTIFSSTTTVGKMHKIIYFETRSSCAFFCLQNWTLWTMPKLLLMVSMCFVESFYK